MRIGVMNIAGGTVDQIALRAQQAEAEGFASYWLPHVFGVDALLALTIAGRETRRIELGTAVLPTYPRHPLSMAQQALTASSVCDGRFTLGIGLSHAVVIEGVYGLSFERPARHMREYLEVLAPLLRGEPTKWEGLVYRVNASLRVKDAKPPGLVVAALGPVMLGVTGRLADGTLTWMAGRRTLAEFIVPRLREAADAAGRPPPRVVAGLSVLLTRDVSAARAHLDEALSMYPRLPSYKATLEREGPGTRPSDIALLGDEASLRDQIEALAAVGVTDLVASVVSADPEAAAETRALLASL